MIGLLREGLSMRVRGLVVGLLGVVCAVLAFGAGSASAVLSYPFDGEMAPASGSFGFLQSSAAVDDENGHTYVPVQEANVVDVFETATRTQLAGSLEGSATPAGSFSGALAVAANNGTGRVYVLDPGHGVVDVFEPSGMYVCQITGKATPSASECNGAAGSVTPAGGLDEPGGVAVDQATGDVYVTDAHNGAIDVFSAGGAYLRQILFSAIPGGGTGQGLAVSDFNGHVYVVNAGSGVVYEFDAAGGYVATWTGANTPKGSFASSVMSVAVDNASGYVYVTNFERSTYVFESSGGYLGEFSHEYGVPYGTAVDQATHEIYISDDNAGSVLGHDVVEVFGPSVIVPGVVTGGATGVTSTTATVSGTVNPAGVQLSDCRFEYGTDQSYGQTVGCVPDAGVIPADSNEHAVSASLTGLAPGTTYHYRLRASNNGCVSCTSYGEDASLTTLPTPVVSGAAAINVTGNSADLQANIDPRGYDTTYRFEWGTSTSYGTVVPVPDADIGAGTSDVAVTTHLSGLSTDSTYYWRVVAHNANGTTTGGDHTFIYSTGGTGLPDNRAYEMVTPVHKNAALIGMVFLGKAPDISEDGSRLILSAVQCFGDAVACPANASTVGTPYEFSRGSGGWTATALAPPAGSVGASDSESFSADAGSVLFTEPTLPLGREDWYARYPDGSFAEIGPMAPSSAGPGRVIGGIALASDGTADLSHIVYESTPLWPFDATNPGVHSLYEYSGVNNSAPLLVGVSGGAGSNDLIGKCGVELGRGRGSSDRYGAVSENGRTVFFTVFQCTSGSGANAGVAVPGTELFARIDESRTVPISARSPLECTAGSGCLGSPPGAASFVGASVDGSKVFFLDTQQLTDSASEDSSNLYEYDMGAPAGRNLTAVSAGDASSGGPRVQGVMGISADGSHVYFVARGVLTGAANAQGETPRNGAENLYVYERDTSQPEGHVSFITTLLESDDEIGTGDRAWDGGVFVADVTPDGRFLVFRSRAALTADASGSGGAQVFRYDALTGQLIRISIGERGFNDNGNGGAGDATIVPPEQFRLGSPRGNPTMSDDGSYVFFQSPVGLTPGALNDVPLGFTETTGEPAYAQNVYEWHEGQVYLLSDGRDVTATTSEFCQLQSSVCLLGTDSTGSNVFFTTADPLVAADTDSQVDVYDARVCTSASPCVAGSVAPVSCQGEACHGTPPAPPPAVGAATSVFSGPGNLTPAPSAPKAKPTRRAHGKAKKHRPVVARRKPKRQAKPHDGHGHSSKNGGK